MIDTILVEYNIQYLFAIWDKISVFNSIFRRFCDWFSIPVDTSHTSLDPRSNNSYKDASQLLVTLINKKQKNSGNHERGTQADLNGSQQKSGTQRFLIARTYGVWLKADTSYS